MLAGGLGFTASGYSAMLFGLKLNALRIANHPLLTVEAEDVLDAVDEIELAELSSCGSTSASEASDVFEFVRDRF